MNTLLMDTSSSKMLVALDVSGNLQAGEEYNTPKHLETLMPAVDQLLKKNNYSVSNIDYLGVVVGPGSFTGIRIAVSTAKAMMMVNKKIKAIEVNSLELIAKSYYKTTQYEGKIAVVIPTTIKKAYLGLFEKGVRIGQDSIVELDLLSETVGDCKVISTVAINESVTVYSISEKDLNNYVQEKIENKSFCSKLSPCYIGVSQAEEQFKNKEKK